MRVIYVCLMAAILHQCRDKPALVNMLLLKHESNHVFIKFSYYKNVISASSREQHFFISSLQMRQTLKEKSSIHMLCYTQTYTSQTDLQCFLKTIRNQFFRKLLSHDYTQKTLISSSTSQAISTSLYRKLHFYPLRTNTQKKR